MTIDRMRCLDEKRYGRSRRRDRLPGDGMSTAANSRFASPELIPGQGREPALGAGCYQNFRGVLLGLPSPIERTSVLQPDLPPNPAHRSLRAFARTLRNLRREDRAST
ncbi:hypothetical protein R1flu_001793 [Riccia fluitans]|uniref:Uncharacterized protein n=1 Tax=Riccia fluitans TaxID=41844 RepID=A0ABD1Y4J1_9MARC